jgi:hypothetical protein
MATKYVNVGAGQTVKVRNTKTKSTGNVHDEIGHGTAVQTVGTSYESGGGYNWWPVTYDGQTRYIERTSATQFLSDTNPNGGGGGGSGTAIAGYCNGSNVNLRTGAGTNNPSVGYLNVGNAVQYINTVISGTGSSSGWFQITSSPLGAGYVAAQYITAGTYSGGGCPVGYAQAYQRIQAYSAANASASNFITRAQYFEALDRIAQQPNCGYEPSGRTPNSSSNTSYTLFDSMDCAHYPFVCRNLQGGVGASSQYDSYTRSNIRGKISDLGGLDELVAGMEIYQSWGSSVVKEHMGVYAGLYVFAGSTAPQHCVYQSVGQAPQTISIAYPKNTGGLGPNKTTLSAAWDYFAWPNYVKL